MVVVVDGADVLVVGGAMVLVEDGAGVIGTVVGPELWLLEVVGGAVVVVRGCGVVVAELGVVVLVACGKVVVLGAPKLEVAPLSEFGFDAPVEEVDPGAAPEVRVDDGVFALLAPAWSVLRLIDADCDR